MVQGQGVFDIPIVEDIADLYKSKNKYGSFQISNHERYRLDQLMRSDK